MAQELSISIRVVDGATAQFQKIAGAAKGMSSGLAQAGSSGASGLGKLDAAANKSATAVEKVGAAANKAGSAIEKTGNAADRAAAGWDKFESNATKAGTAVGAAAAVIGKLGSMALQQQRSIEGLERAYGEAGGEILRFTERLDAATNYTDEATRAAAMTASTLARNYGLTADQIQEVMTISADLAAVTGRDLVDVTERVAAALRGEAEAAEALGLTMNQSAIDAENLTLSMSNQEAAAFRLAALQEQAAFASGAAAEQARGLQGAMASVADHFQDAATGAGAFLGPVAQLASPLAEVALALPLVGAGLGKIATSAAAGSVIGGVGTAGAAAAGAMAALAPAIAGVGVAAAAATPAVIAMSVALGNAAETRAEFEGESAAMVDFLDRMGLAADTNAQKVVGLFRDFGAQSVNLKDAQGEISNTTTAFNELFDELTRLDQQQFAGLMKQLDMDKFLALDPGEIQKAAYLVSQMAAANDQASYTALENARAQRAVEMSTRASAEAAREATQALHAYDDVERLRARTSTETAAAHEAARQAEVAALLETSAAYDKYAGFMESTGGDSRRAAAEEVAAAAERQAAAEALANQLTSALIPGIDGAAASFQGLARPGEDVLDVLARLGPTTELVNASFARLGDGLNDAATGMDAALGTFQQIDALGQRSQGAADIAADLVGDPGTYAAVDDLLQRGRISLEQYTAAQEDQVRIAGANAAVQEDLNVLRLGQLDGLASAEAGYANYIDQLTRATPAEQAHALAMLDTANQAKVASAYSAAYAAELGELPPEVATEIIANAAQADPVLKGLLDDFGLIEVGADGTVTVNVAGAEQITSVQSQLDGLQSKTITVGVDVQLDEATANAALAGRGLPGLETTATQRVTIDADTGPAESAIAGVQRQAEAFAGQTFAATLDATDQASAVVGAAQADGEAFGAATFAATLEATDNATAVVDAAESNAQAFATTYTATLDAADSASDDISVATAAAAVFAKTYTAGLQADDQATGTINAVAAALAGLDGSTATVYVNAVDNTGGALPGRMLGGAVYGANVPRAALGRVVRVGEAGEELAVLPHGSMVMPHGAAQSRMASAERMTGPAPKQATAAAGNPFVPEASMREAYRKGGESAKAYFDGLLSEARSRAKSLRSELTAETPTLFESEEDFYAAVEELEQAERAKAKLKRAKEDAERFDAAMAKRTAAAEELAGDLGTTVAEAGVAAVDGAAAAGAAAGDSLAQQMIASVYSGLLSGGGLADAVAEPADDAGTVAGKAVGEALAEETAKAGAEAGQALADGLETSLESADGSNASKIAQGFADSLKAVAGNAEAVGQAVRGFYDEVRGLASGFAAAAKGSAKATDRMAGDLEDLEADAEDSGEAAGEGLGDGLAAGLADSKAGDAVKELGTSLEDVAGGDYEAEIAADDEQAAKAIQGTEQDLRSLNGDRAQVSIAVDDSDWRAFVDDFRGMDGDSITVTVNQETKKEKADEGGESGKRLGGVVHPVPAAAMGRTIRVGEAGEELVVLPYGSQVMPHGAAQARMAADARGGGGSPVLNVYGTIHVHPATADLANEIAGAVAGWRR